MAQQLRGLYINMGISIWISGTHIRPSGVTECLSSQPKRGGDWSTLASHTQTHMQACTGKLIHTLHIHTHCARHTPRHTHKHTPVHAQAKSLVIITDILHISAGLP